MTFLHKLLMLYERDTYLTAEDAKQCGIIDAVITTRAGSGKQTADLSSFSTENDTSHKIL